MLLENIYILSLAPHMEESMTTAAIEALEKKLESLQKELDANKNARQSASMSHTVGGLPESKHLDGSNCNDWKFLMENFLVDACL